MHMQAVDHAPLTPWFWKWQLPGGQRTFSSQREMVDYIINELAADAEVHTWLENAHTPGVTSEFWTSDDGAVLHKVFHTPDGDLCASVRNIEDYPTPNDIPLISDHNPSRFIKPWIQSIEDVERYAHVCRPPDRATIERCRPRIQADKALADEYGVPLVAYCGYGLTALIDMMGAESAVIASMEHFELLDRFMRIEHETSLAAAETLIGLGVDVIVRNGFYETCEFWSPRQIETLVLPRVNAESVRVRQLGGISTYLVCTGILPLLEMYRDSEIDSLRGYETKLCGQSLSAIAGTLAGRMALWGGVSDCGDLNQPASDTVRNAVRDVFARVAPHGGCLLAASPSIKPERPVENVEAMLDQWRRCITSSVQTPVCSV